MKYTKDARGFTLMEMVVVLAVIAILAAILTPIVNSYVDRARLNSARNDTKNIAAAIVQFNMDAKFWPIYTAFAQVPNGTVFDYQATDGEDVTLTGTGWSTLTTTSGALNSHLNTNFYVLGTSGGPGTPAYRGPYLELSPDPWGSRYYVTSKHLKPGSTSAAYVLSPGPDQIIQTTFDQSRTGLVEFDCDEDDICARIR